MRKTALTLLGAVAVMAAAAPQKTAWRDPDLQGIWAQKYQIPLQRPARDAGRPTLTGEEVRQREAERARQAAAAPSAAIASWPAARSRITFADGRRLFAGSDGTGAPK